MVVPFGGNDKGQRWCHKYLSKSHGWKQHRDPRLPVPVVVQVPVLVLLLIAVMLVVLFCGLYMGQDPYPQLQLPLSLLVQLPDQPPSPTTGNNHSTVPTLASTQHQHQHINPATSSSTWPTMPLPVDLSPRQLKIAQCRWNLEEYLRPLISQWLQDSLPLLDWVYHLAKPQQQQQYRRRRQQSYYKYLILLVTIHLDPKSTEIPFRQANHWHCQDQDGNRRPAKILPGGKNYIASQRILMQCSRMNQPLVGLYHHPTGYFYNVTPWNDCDSLESSISSDSVSSSTSTNPAASSSLSSWKLPSISIGACLRIRGMHHFLEPWIRYHRHLGIQHFWIFLNEPTNLTTVPTMFLPKSSSHHNNIITWIPYNYYAPDFVHDTPNNSYSRSSILRHSKHFWQSTTQMQCLYHAKRLGLEWIITLDVDEYIWIRETTATGRTNTTSTTTITKTGHFQDKHTNSTAITTHPSSPLSLVQSILAPYTAGSAGTSIGALTMWSIPFGSQQIQPSKAKQKKQQLLLLQQQHHPSNTNTTTSTTTTTTHPSSELFILDYVYRQQLKKIVANHMDR